jgi:hypothetical protein
MRFIFFLVIVGGIFWAIDKTAYGGRYTQAAEENAAYIGKLIGKDLRSTVDRLVGKN